MPISAANKKRYPKDWPEIRRRILDRARFRCEQCNAPDRHLICRDVDGGTYMLCDGGEVFDAITGAPRGRARGSEYNGSKFLYVILTIAHLDHTPENNADDNLKALCQRCHLAYDAPLHKANAAKTRRGRKAAGDLFEEKPAKPGK